MSVFSRFLEYFALSGLGACAALLIGVYLWRISGRARIYARRYGIIGLLAAAFFGFAAITEGPPDEDYKDAVQEELAGEGETNAVYGAMLMAPPRRTLPSPATSNLNLEPHRLVSVVTNEVYDYTMPTNAVEYAPWRLRGAAEDWFKLGLGGLGGLKGGSDWWRFPKGTNEYSAFRVFTDGTIRPKLHSLSNEIVAVGAPMSAIPDLSRFWYSVGANDSRILTWENFAAGRIANQVSSALPPSLSVSAQIQLFRSGDYIVRSNNVERLYRFIDPFEVPEEEWGQSDADKAYIDAAVGTNLENGYYKLTVTVPPSVGRRTLITVGYQQLVADRPGDYAFLLEKGEEYELSLLPFSPDITFAAVDDIRPPMMGLSFGAWTKDSGWHKIIVPERFLPGWCYWIPKFTGSPDVSFIGVGDDIEFRAVLSDCPHYCTATYDWTSEDENVYIESPNAECTRVTFCEMPRWASTVLKVTATLGTNTLESVLRFNYGREEYPEPICCMSAPEVVFVNDDSRTSRYYRVELTLDAPLSANAQVELSCSGVGASFFSDEKGQHPLTEDDLTMETDGGNPVASRTFYMSCANIGSGTLSATFTIEGAGTEVISKDFVVIEPLRKLVCTEPTPEGGYYNPSRLVAGSNAWLKVGVNGDFDANDVEWRIVSGPGRIVAVDGFTAKVAPTATSGEVVVEAAFGHDSMIQPRFVLPIVEVKRVPIEVCIVADAKGRLATSIDKIEQKIEFANEVFSQVGIEFYLQEPVLELHDASYWVLSEHDFTNRAGRIVRSRNVSNQAIELYSHLGGSNGAVRTFWVDQITNGTKIAFTNMRRKCCVFSNFQSATNGSFAHELAHALGAYDIYFATKQNSSNEMNDANSIVGDLMFGAKHSDWGSDGGRGFYETADSQKVIIQKMLMHGRDSGGVDIPYGSVRGLSDRSRTPNDLTYVSVGSVAIREGGVQ